MRKLFGMCTKLPQSPLKECLHCVLPVVNKEIKLVDATKLFPKGKRILERWVSNYKKYCNQGLAPRSTKPKSQPRELPIRIKKRIINMRRETNLCARKMNYKLKKEGLEVSDRVIGKILKLE
jgi:transposase